MKNESNVYSDFLISIMLVPIVVIADNMDDDIE